MSIFSYIKSHAVLVGTIVFVAVAGTIIGGRVASTKKNDAPSTANVKRVSLVDADNFRSDSGIVSVDGLVQAVTQVDLKSQTSGPLSYVAVSLGETISAGQVIAELSNADIRAQLDQAKLSLSLEGVSADSSRKSAGDAIRDSYLKADEAIHTQVDAMIFNSTKTSPQLSSFITDQVLYQRILAARSDLTSIFIVWNKTVDSLPGGLSDAALTSALKLSERNVALVRDLLDMISTGLNDAATKILPSDLGTITAWKAAITAARSSIGGAASSLTSAEKSFSSSVVTEGSAGGAPSSVASAGVKNLEAQLAKTVIRSPINGKVAALPLRGGELATPGTLIATIVGPGALQIDAFASAEDIGRIAKGARVMIEGTTTGTVSSISPSVNPLNKKVEVKILVTGTPSTALVIGDNVSAKIEASSNSVSSGPLTYRLPIQDVKIVPGEAYIFTVDADSKLIRHNVTLNKVDGDFVEVASGIESGMKIVSPVYELSEGETVITN